MDFMEDHAYMGRTETYHLYLDSAASFTMEYIDNILAMRANDSYPWYVPTARVIFDVDINKVGWRDIPYFVHKRSEEVGLTVRAYLTHKWRVEFPNTGIWNYVRYSFLSDAILDDNHLPQDWSNQAALYFSWFHSIGFNRYNGHSLHDLLHDPREELSSSGEVVVSRALESPPTFENVRRPPHDKTAKDILPFQKGSKLINITLVNESIPVTLSVSSDCRPAHCGLLVVDKHECACYTYISPFEIKRDYGMVGLFDLLKLPSRALKFAQMKYTTTSDKSRFHGATVHCYAEDSNCKMTIPAFPKTARIVQWSWFARATR